MLKVPINGGNQVLPDSSSDLRWTESCPNGAHVSLMATQISKDSQALALGVSVVRLRMPV